MNYEIVTLAEKTIIGVSAKTSHCDPNMGNVISGLWENLYNNGINAKIENKVNEYAIGIYSDYMPDGSYTVTAGNEVSKISNQDFDIKVISAGKYAKFSVHGNMTTAVSGAWAEIWKMDLNRSFTCDFEEYLNSDFNNADIDIYIALK